MNKHKLVIEHPHDNIKQKQSPFIKFKSHFSSHFHSHQSAFTIVELLVVIVVIGILATVVFVSYSGVTKKATEAVIKSDLNNNGKLLELYQVENGSYPTTLDAVTYCPTLPIPSTNHCLKASNGNTLSYTGGERYYSLIEANPTSNISYTVTETGTIAETISTFAYAWGGSEWDAANSIAITADGGYVIVGETDSFGAGSDDVFIAKFTSDGNLIWDKTWGGTGDERVEFVTTVTDGGYVVTGRTQSFGAGSDDVFIAKFTSDGNLIWDKTWGGTGDDSPGYGMAIVAIADGGFVLTGDTDSFSDYSYNVFIAKFTSDGTLVWDKTWGGADIDISSSIIIVADGGYMLIGRTHSFGVVGGDAFLAKFTSDGSLVWDKSWGGAGWDSADSVIATIDDDYVLIGTTTSFGAGVNDIFHAKFTSDGTLVWDKTWGGRRSEYSGSAVASADGGYVVTGSTVTDSFGAGFYDFFLVKFSANGVLANCLAPMCQDPVAKVADPIATIKDIDASESYPDVVEGDPLASVNDPTATITTIVAP